MRNETQTRKDETMKTTTNLRPEAIISTNMYGKVEVAVSYPDAGLDRPVGVSTIVKNMAIARRLAAAINAGVAHTDPVVKTDINGKTYVCDRRNYLGRKLNADLKRMGF